MCRFSLVCPRNAGIKFKEKEKVRKGGNEIKLHSIKPTES